MREFQNSLRQITIFDFKFKSGYIICIMEPNPKYDHREKVPIFEPETSRTRQAGETTIGIGPASELQQLDLECSDGVEIPPENY